MASTITLKSVNTGGKALERVIREAEKRGKRDGYLSLREIFAVANAVKPKEMPDALYSTYTSARSAGQTRVTQVMVRVRAALRAVAKADKNRNGKLSPTELAELKGLALELVRARVRLPKYLKKVLSLKAP